MSEALLLSELLQGVTVDAALSRDFEVPSAATDAAECTDGSIFICLSAQPEPAIIDCAARHGAAAALVCRKTESALPQLVCADPRAAAAYVYANLYGNPQSKLRIIGITGTNGKTTVAAMVRHILESAGKSCAIIGTNGNTSAGHTRITGYTTPVPELLYAEMARAVQDGCEYLVTEVSSHALAQKRTAPVKFDVGVFTNLTRDHLDYHGDMESYALAKLSLFSQAATGVVNADSGYASRFIRACHGRLLTYSSAGQGELDAQNISQSADGVSFDLYRGGLVGRVELPVPGLFSVSNALAAIGAAVCTGVNVETAAAALKSFPGVAGRMEKLPNPLGFYVIIDYAHTPDGMEKLLSCVRAFAKRRIIVLFGCGGNRDRGKRAQICRIAANNADYLVITSDNPRDEDPYCIIRDILAGLEDCRTPFAVVENRREATELALREAERGDVVVLAGKGHETYQLVSGKKLDYDERQIVAQILAQMKEV